MRLLLDNTQTNLMLFISLAILLGFRLSFEFVAILLLECKHACFVVNSVILTAKPLVVATIRRITDNVDFFMSIDSLILHFLGIILGTLYYVFLFVIIFLLLLFLFLLSFCENPQKV